MAANNNETPATLADIVNVSKPQKTFADDLEVVLDNIKQTLIQKNRKYGDSVLRPIRCFSKLTPLEGINIRLDDKIKRLMSGQKDDTEDTELDLIGYLLIKQIALRRMKEYGNDN